MRRRNVLHVVQPSARAPNISLPVVCSVGHDIDAQILTDVIVAFHVALVSSDVETTVENLVDDLG